MATGTWTTLMTASRALPPELVYLEHEAFGTQFRAKQKIAEVRKLRQYYKKPDTEEKQKWLAEQMRRTRVTHADSLVTGAGSAQARRRQHWWRGRGRPLPDPRRASRLLPRPRVRLSGRFSRRSAPKEPAMDLVDLPPAANTWREPRFAM